MKIGIGLFLLLPLVAAAGAAPAEETAGGVAVRETCEGRPKGSACWMGLADRPECYLWNPNLQPGETATWTGECSGRLAHGTGTIAWVWDGGREISESTGRLEDGKRHGTWVERSADGDVREGPYVEGKRHGDWVVRYKSGRVDEGSVVDGKRHGDWVERSANGRVGKGPYENGKRQGGWVLRWADGGVGEGPYVEGEDTRPLGLALGERGRIGRPLCGGQEARPLGPSLRGRDGMGRPLLGRQEGRQLGYSQPGRARIICGWQPDTAIATPAVAFGSTLLSRPPPASVRFMGWSFGLSRRRDRPARSRSASFAADPNEKAAPAWPYGRFTGAGGPHHVRIGRSTLKPAFPRAGAENRRATARTAGSDTALPVSLFDP